MTFRAFIVLCLLPLAAPANCPMPKEVPELPESWFGKAEPTVITNGNKIELYCQNGKVGKFDANAGSHSYADKFFCNPNGKWTTAAGYEAPPMLSCGSYLSSITYCVVYNMQTPSGTKARIALYSGQEKYCPAGHEMKMEDGTDVKSLTCKGYVLTMTNDNGSNIVIAPTIKCVPAQVVSKCKQPDEVPVSDFPIPYNSDGKVQITTAGGIDSLYCKRPGSLFVGQFGAGASAHTTGYPFQCNPSTAKWEYNGYKAPERMSCGYDPTGSVTYCGITDVQANGATSIFAIYHDEEEYCTAGSQMKLESGAIIDKLTCTGGSLQAIINGVTSPQPPRVRIKCVPQVLAKCPLPSKVPDSMFPSTFNRGGDFVLKSAQNTQYLLCEPAGTSYIQQFGAGADAHVLLDSDSYYCNEATKQWQLRKNGYVAPSIISCGIPSAVKNYCVSIDDQDGAQATIGIFANKVSYCPSPLKVHFSNGQIIKSLTCVPGSRLSIVNANGNTIEGPTPLKCAVPSTAPTTAVATTTTTTEATTTTVKPDAPPSADLLWNVMYYYNYGLILHAFCADAPCISAIQSNGIGYDMVNYKGPIGRAVQQNSIDALRASCPTGSKHFRNLAFTRAGNHYVHNLDGNGLKQGWVSAVNGACGATKPIKRWKCRYSDDLMYATDLESNTFYNGLVQDYGAIHFYMYY